MVILTELSEVLIHGVDKVPVIIAERYGKNVGIRYEERFNYLREDFHDLLRGYVTEDEFFETLLEGGDLPFTACSLKKIYTEEFSKSIPDTFSTYVRISAHPRSFTDSTMEEDFPQIHIVSDHIAEHIEEITNNHSDVFTIARKVFWSCDIGMIKRDPKFFPRLLKELNLKPEECLFIDSCPINIACAEEAGIRSLRFFDAYQLEAELTGLGFEFYA